MTLLLPRARRVRIGARHRSGRAQPEEDLMKRLHSFHLSHAGRQRVRYRARAFNSDCHLFEVGRSAIGIRAKCGYVPASDLSTDGPCSLPSSQTSSPTPEIIGLCDVGGLFSRLSETCANVVASASARIVEHFRQLLDPMVAASGTSIEIEGLGRRLVRDAHAEPGSDGSDHARPLLGA
jgi:hypothetical protein